MFTLFLTGCSAKLVYNYADWLIFWKIGDYVELNSEQKKVLENKVEELQNWHRTEELPYYSALLKQLRKRVGCLILTRPYDMATFDYQIIS